MCKSRYSETQIVGILKQVEGGPKVHEVCRVHRISEAAHYLWKSKYDGMEVADIRGLKELEDENRRLQQFYAGVTLKNRALKDVIAKKL